MGRGRPLLRSLDAFTPSRMVGSILPSCEGIFAIHKPAGLTSAQVIRNAQAAFKGARLFQPWIDQEQKRKDDEALQAKGKWRGRKSRQPAQVKMGHGGTLDPGATGVLVLGVGNGTKSLSQFLDCTKSYETVVLFGAASDTYDCWGKIVARKEYKHITKEMVEEALEKFRGPIMQKPPIFSALRIQGKKLYEYARQGLELPTEIQERPVEVESLEMVEWMEGGTHQHRYPKEEAESEEKTLADQLLHLEGTEEQKAAASEVKENHDASVATGSEAKPAATEKVRAAATEENKDADATTGAKRKRSDAGADEAEQAAVSDVPSPKRSKPPAGALQTASAGPDPSSPVCAAPAVRVRMTVTSGFYVRSLAHDLGDAVGSLAMMTELVRSRQGDYELHKNVLPYEDLAKGEEVWGPQIQSMLEAWNRRSESETRGKSGSNGSNGSSSRRAPRSAAAAAAPEGKARRRNSSSPES